MKKQIINLLSLLLALVMILAAFASCGGDKGGETPTTAKPSTETEKESDESTGETTGSETAETTGSETTGPETTESENTESSEGTTVNGETTESTETSQSGDTETENGETSETTAALEYDETVELNYGGNTSDIVELGNSLSNTVQSYYENSQRDTFVMENSNSVIRYNMTGSNLVSSITDKEGNVYVENTMDVFVRMKSGQTFYASSSVVPPSTNIYRMGYYYYENRIENQNFANGDVASALDIDYMGISKTHHIQKTGADEENKTISFEITDRNDPQLYFPNVKFKTEMYSYLELTLKANSGIDPEIEVFIWAGKYGTYSSDQRTFQSISVDGKYHTYIIPLNSVPDYNKVVKGIRIDVNGKPGSTFEIAGARVISMGEGCPEALFLQRSFLMYSDKAHQIIQVAATQETTDIAAIGTLTTIPVERVSGVVIKDVRGWHYSCEDKIAWGRVEYMGFMIEGVGVFGYIIPSDGSGGDQFKVTLDDNRENYVIEIVGVPEGFTISPSEANTGNANDYFMGNRIYTDNETTFDKFIYEAECEVNPLTEEDVFVNPAKSGGSKFLGYDALRGYYKFSVDLAGGFNGPFHNYPNRHFAVNFTFKGDELNRRIYVVGYTADGALECSVMLNNQSMLLPVPVQVAKNFKGDGENTIFNLDDYGYGESMVPITVTSGSKTTYTMLQLYQNWGTVPLKQISSIQFHSPYYHLSVGVTETNCVVPYGSGLSLPDFRAVSAPYWQSQPQHNSCGTHSFVQYLNNEGINIGDNFQTTHIDSHGPTYAEMSNYFVSHDGKFTFTYNHLELPQTDENRTFYQIKIDFVEDLTVGSFKDDFTIYKVKSTDPSGVYQKVGYLNSDNVCSVADANRDKSQTIEYVLGDNCPYFSFFYMDKYTANWTEGYSNPAFLIYQSKVIVGGEEQNISFMLKDNGEHLVLTLNAGELNFKAGDSITIDGILLPWGSQELDPPENEADRDPNKMYYDTVVNEATGELYMDKNVRDVREDSLLNPMTLIAGENCEKVESVFLPRAKTTNGKSAEFTVSGGANNIAVRVYGYDIITVPVVEEYVDGEWVVVDLTSMSAPDQQGYGYLYDGYTVFYDDDGTYSYAFAFDIGEGEPRTFRITADKEFEGFDEPDPFEDLPLNVYISSENIAQIGASLGTPYGCSKFENNTEGGFFRFWGNGVNKECYLVPFRENPIYPTTGQYAVLKYRIPVTNTVSFNSFEVFASTVSTGATGNGDCMTVYGSAIADGEWHVLVFDLSKVPSIVPEEDGSYKIKFMRFDVMNSSKAIPATDYVDIAYFGICDNLEDICKLNSDMESLIFAQDDGIKSLDVKTGEITTPEAPETPDTPADGLIILNTPQTLVDSDNGGCDVALSADGKYVTYTARGANEGYVFAYSNALGTTETGKYAIFKYRLPKGLTEYCKSFEIFASTTLATATGGSSIKFGGVIADGEWQVVIVDLSGIETFTAKDGKYYAKHVRLDVIDDKREAPYSIDIEYFGMHNDYEAILSFVTADNTVTFVNSEGKASIVNSKVVIETEENGMIYYADPSEIAEMKLNGCVGALSAEGDYFRLTGNGSNEGYITLFADKSDNKVTGQYLAIKYRVVSGGIHNFEFFASTTLAAPDGSSSRQLGISNAEGKWYLMIVDLSCLAKYTDLNQQFYAKHIRIDIFNAMYGDEAVVDIAYFALHNKITEILTLAKDEFETAVYVDKKGSKSTINNDGSFVEPDPFAKEEIIIPPAGEETTLPANTDGVYFISPEALANGSGRSGVTVALSEGKTYARYSGNGRGTEGFVALYSDKNASVSTGKYIAIKYRYYADNALKTECWDFYAATDGRTQAAGDGDHLRVIDIPQDGEWHVVIVDLSVISKYEQKNGAYNPSLVRFDMFNGSSKVFEANSVMDISFAAMSDDISDLYSLVSDMESVTVVNGSTKTQIDPKTGNEIQ